MSKWVITCILDKSSQTVYTTLIQKFKHSKPSEEEIRNIVTQHGSILFMQKLNSIGGKHEIL